MDHFSDNPASSDEIMRYAGISVIMGVEYEQISAYDVHYKMSVSRVQQAEYKFCSILFSLNFELFPLF